MSLAVQGPLLVNGTRVLCKVGSTLVTMDCDTVLQLLQVFELVLSDSGPGLVEPSLSLVVSNACLGKFKIYNDKRERLCVLQMQSSIFHPQDYSLCKGQLVQQMKVASGCAVCKGMVSQRQDAGFTRALEQPATPDRRLPAR